MVKHKVVLGVSSLALVILVLALLNARQRCPPLASLSLGDVVSAWPSDTSLVFYSRTTHQLSALSVIDGRLEFVKVESVDGEQFPGSWHNSIVSDGSKLYVASLGSDLTGDPEVPDEKRFATPRIFYLSFDQRTTWKTVPSPAGLDIEMSPILDGGGMYADTSGLYLNTKTGLQCWNPVSGEWSLITQETVGAQSLFMTNSCLIYIVDGVIHERVRNPNFDLVGSKRVGRDSSILYATDEYVVLQFGDNRTYCYRRGSFDLQFCPCEVPTRANHASVSQEGTVAVVQGGDKPRSRQFVLPNSKVYMNIPSVGLSNSPIAWVPNSAIRPK